MSLVGTTLTGYVYFWQTVGQAEDQVPWRLHRARQADSLLGSLFAVAVFWFILIASGATLGVHHLSAGTAQGAARALRPVAGPFAGDLFAFGLLASALIATRPGCWWPGTGRSWPSSSTRARAGRSRGRGARRPLRWSPRLRIRIGDGTRS